MVLANPYCDANDWTQTMGAEKKQSLIYEKESSEIMRKLALKSFGDGYKVMIIWQPEKMNATCANKLLKLLEEPPAMTVFLLVSEHPEMLLPTIISRLRPIAVPRLSDEQIESALRNRQPAVGTQEAKDAVSERTTTHCRNSTSGRWSWQKTPRANGNVRSCSSHNG